MRFLFPMALCVLALSQALPAEEPRISDEGKACLECHGDTTPGIVEQWKSSTHAAKGVDCYSCHKANEGDPATFDHYGHKIAVIDTQLLRALPRQRSEASREEPPRRGGAVHWLARQHAGRNRRRRPGGQ